MVKTTIATRTKIILGVAIGLAVGGFAMAALPYLNDYKGEQSYSSVAISPTQQISSQQILPSDITDGHNSPLVVDDTMQKYLVKFQENTQKEIQSTARQLSYERQGRGGNARKVSQVQSGQNNCDDPDALAIFKKTGSITCGLITWNFLPEVDYREKWFDGDPRPYLLKYSEALTHIEELTGQTGRNLVVNQLCSSQDCERQTGRINIGYALSAWLGGFTVIIPPYYLKEDLIPYSLAPTQPLDYALLHEFAHAVDVGGIQFRGGPLAGDEDPALMEAWADIMGPLMYSMYTGDIIEPEGQRSLLRISTGAFCFREDHTIDYFEDRTKCADFHKDLGEIIDYYGLGTKNPPNTFNRTWTSPSDPRCRDCNEGIYRIIKRPRTDDTGHGRGSTFISIIMLLYKDFKQNGNESKYYYGLKDTIKYIQSFRFNDYLASHGLNTRGGTGREYEELFYDSIPDIAVQRKVVARRANFFVYLISAYTGTDLTAKFEQWGWPVFPVTRASVQKLGGRTPTKEETYLYLSSLLESESVSCGENGRTPCRPDTPGTFMGCKPPHALQKDKCMSCPKTETYDNGNCILCGDRGQKACRPGENDTNGSGCLRNAGLWKDNLGKCVLPSCPDGTAAINGQCVSAINITPPGPGACGRADQKACDPGKDDSGPNGCLRGAPLVRDSSGICRPIQCPDGTVSDNLGSCVPCGNNGQRACFKPGSGAPEYCNPGFKVVPGIPGSGMGPQCATITQ